jgi:threonine/homoserine/homoserine lactone efflux protein
MTPSLALAFALAMLVRAAVPGPGVFTTLGRSAAGEMRSGPGVVGGIVLASVLSAYAILASTARGAFRSSRSVKRLNRLAGSVMIATGVVVAVRR